MKKLISVIFLFSAFILVGELIYSPLMHNHTDFIKRSDCPAHFITSHQFADNVSFTINLNPLPSFTPVFIKIYVVENLYTGEANSIKNKAPPIS